MRAARSGWCIALATFSIALLAMLGISGCGEPESVRVHDEVAAPKPATPAIPAEQKRFRTLAAMVPSDDGRENGPGWWFLKLTGPAATVNKYQADFDKLIDSILATPDEKNPITWTLPPGWTREDVPAGGMRFATLKSPGGEVEIPVTRFGGSELANVQRWWGELWGKDKVQEFTAAMLPEYVQQRKVNGRLILRVDLSGPNEPPKRPMMMNPHGGM